MGGLETIKRTDIMKAYGKLIEVDVNETEGTVKFRVVPKYNKEVTQCQSPTPRPVNPLSPGC